MNKLLTLLMILSCALVSCNKEGDSSESQSVAGSLSGFSIIGDELYVLSLHQVDVYGIDGDDIKKMSTITTNEELETIYPFQNHVFLGSTTGMLVYDVDDPYHPQHVETVSHIRSCDPVVADSNYAYVTLRSNGNRCANGVDVLYVYDLDDTFKPTLIKEYDMSHPQGMALMDSLLLVCDDGLKLYNRKDPYQLELIQHINSFETADALAYEDEILITTNERLEMFKMDSARLKIQSVIY